jgi:Fe-S-cluster containining protein
MRPLLARPGAAFRCFGDGLCCTDIHALGVLTRSEVKTLRQRDKLSVIYSDDVDGYCLKPIDSRCLFLDGQDRCGIHAQYGAAAKPAGCRRFPYGLVSTPYGGRVTTEHRCPCRTLGTRPEIMLDDAEASLRNNAGRLESDKDVPSKIVLRAGQRVAFDSYLAIETQMIARLNAGDRAEEVLAAKVLPDLTEGGWAMVAVEQIDMRDASAGGEVCAWFGDALLELAAGHTPPARPRPWAWAYARASARPGNGQTAEYVYNDWIADELWMFRWLDWTDSFDVARSELATRLRVAQLIQSRIERENVPPAQAAAEAVMICELVSEGSEWPKAVGNIATDPSPAEPLSVPARLS